jgi:DNA-binding MarR family transcriptional regulator
MARVRPAGGASAAQVAQVLNSLRRVVRAFRAMAQVAQDVMGTSGAQHFVLQKLAEAPALSLNDLAARTMTHKSSVSVVVKNLVDRGLVRRRRSSADGRSIVLTLTSAGRRAIERAPESAQTRMITALRRFPRRDLETFSGLFARFTDELGVGTLEPTMLFEDESAIRRAGPPGRQRRTISRQTT